jgi:uncharacterized membrane protein YebE (DUF533 family)
MIDRLLKQLSGSPAATGFAGGLAGGVAGGMLTSKRGRKMAKKAAKYGGLALLGGLAWSAWQKSRQGGAPPAFPNETTPTSPPQAAVPPPVPEGSAFLPAQSDAAAREALGLLLTRAMIAAAKADGKLDGAESRAIRGQLESLEVSPAERSALMAEVANPPGVDELAAAVPSPEVASEVYLAALMAIETDTPEEREWLDRLARALKLEPGLVELLHAEADAD